VTALARAETTLTQVFPNSSSAAGARRPRASASVSDNAVTRFTRSSNHQAASGDKARQAPLARAPPDKPPMPISEARAMMGNLVSAWMGSL
jgi:hypothetical protein